MGRGDEDRVYPSEEGRRGSIPAGGKRCTSMAGKCEEKPMAGSLIPLPKADMQVKQDYKGAALLLPHPPVKTA